MTITKYKKKFRIIAGTALVVLIIAGAGLAGYYVRYTATNNRSCAKCHPELAELWKKSEGHPAQKTRCYQCHSRGLALLPREWNILKHGRDQLAPPEYLADDELTSQRCLDCHQIVLDPDYKLKKNIIRFNHRIHNDEGISCVDCHRGAGHEYLKGGTNRPSASECLDCHRKEFEGPPKNQKCFNCHQVVLAPGKNF